MTFKNRDLSVTKSKINHPVLAFKAYAFIYFDYFCIVSPFIIQNLPIKMEYPHLQDSLDYVYAVVLICEEAENIWHKHQVILFAICTQCV